MKPPLLLLHGAIGSKDYLHPLSKLLESTFSCHSLNFHGHGGEAIREGAFHIEGFAQDVLAYLDAHSIEKANIFGYSMGGYVGLWLARHYPGRIEKLFTLATKLDWNPDMAKKESRMLNPEGIEAKVPKFAEVLKQRHAPQDWKEVLHASADMMLEMGDSPPLQATDFEHIEHAVRLAVGDRDKMVGIDESRVVVQLLPNASFSVFPQTPHPIERADPEYLAFEINHFFKT